MDVEQSKFSQSTAKCNSCTRLMKWRKVTFNSEISAPELHPFRISRTLSVFSCSLLANNTSQTAASCSDKLRSLSASPNQTISSSLFSSWLLSLPSNSFYCSCIKLHRQNLEWEAVTTIWTKRMCCRNEEKGQQEQVQINWKFRPPFNIVNGKITYVSIKRR